MVTLEQMIGALVSAVEDRSEGVRVIEVSGNSGTRNAVEYVNGSAAGED